MKRWDKKINEYVESPKEIEKFLNEIEAVCKKYNLSICHEDIGGAFMIENYDIINIEWLRDASLNITKKNK